MAESKRPMNDEEVETEISRLQASPQVKLALKEKSVRYRRRQYMYTLRWYEKRGKQLEADGITMDILNQMADEIEPNLSADEGEEEQ